MNGVSHVLPDYVALVYKVSFFLFFHSSRENVHYNIICIITISVQNHIKLYIKLKICGLKMKEKTN